MKFVDEATIRVEAGKGGNGCLSFRREKYIPEGGPNGGDGGDGGSVYLRGKVGMSTLVDFRYQRLHRAQNGEPGKGKDCTGRSGDDCIIDVPLGTLVFDTNTEEEIGEITKHGEKMLVAQGGFHGLGNTRFKSSVNRTPRQTTPGSPGEVRELRFELRLLADVGLLGFPNAGKSTFVRSISAATPKVADYPFTTLYPNLGVVKVEDYRSFVVADVPGLIEGAAEGAGLGVQFLKHLSRTRVLLHLVDVTPPDGSDPVAGVKTLQDELRRFSPELAEKPCWLLLNKVDLLSEEEQQAICDDIVSRLQWQGAVYRISALKKDGTQQLCYDLMEYVDKMSASLDESEGA